MTDHRHTHELVRDGDLITKRYVDGKPGAAEREWRALTLLAEHAPALAPEPVAFDGRSVTMTWIDGLPMRGMEVRAEHVAAMAEARARLHTALPYAVLRDVPERPWADPVVTDWVRSRATAWEPRGPLDGRAVEEGLRWLESRSPGEPGTTPAFGAGDGNLANFLWDGSRVRLVDFEDCGRSDVAYEVAEIAEHVSMWVDGEVEIVPAFGLSPREERRTLEHRRLHALMWLFLLSHDSADAPRNPPGTFERQAERVLARLAA
ncbi:aminoglycoside phosphotransferase family protein [Nonomuraea longispora]|uniref:Aminoglycoside phosphotransferase family protein n=1 Tax=Nonomuraea longispora TaxID=1848320 RepID=A0A4R4MYR9_9ACTN|nr:aminoglycoside phosphotransferase family protein [Nonomuraea longispora]TDC01449.1 aminoglycoside phosphotransferase family protein [Nonomuraea longispora]